MLKPRVSRKLPPPADVVSLREAESRTGVDLRTIREWITTGKGVPPRRLATYYFDSMEIPLVSVAAVVALRDQKKARSKTGIGPVGLSLPDEAASAARELAELLGKRIGGRFSISQAVKLAIAEALRRERSGVA